MSLDDHRYGVVWCDTETKSIYLNWFRMCEFEFHEEFTFQDEDWTSEMQLTSAATDGVNMYA